MEALRKKKELETENRTTQQRPQTRRRISDPNGVYFLPVYFAIVYLSPAVV